MEELITLQLGERSVRLVLVIIHASVLLIPEEVLYSLPPQVGLPFLQHDQVAEDQEEAVARVSNPFQLLPLVRHVSFLWYLVMSHMPDFCSTMLNRLEAGVFICMAWLSP